MTITSPALRPAAVARGDARRLLIAVLRAAAGILMIAAIAAQYLVSLAHWRRTGIRDLDVQTADFLSAFTHEVNVAGGALLIAGAVLLMRRMQEPRWFAVLRLCLLSAIVVVSVVYNLLLRPLPVPPGSQLDWANEVMHVVAPALVVLDVVLAPHPRRLGFRAAWLVAVYPVTWAVYTFVRGPLVPNEVAGTPYTYPYPFLDPHGPGGWGSVALLVGVLTAFTVVLGFAGVALWRLEDRLAARRASPTTGP